MTSNIGPPQQAQIEGYLNRLRHALGTLAPEDLEEIVREIRGHIVERAESTDPLNEAALKGILNALGNPEDIASLYQSRALVARARASVSPLLILTTTIRWAGMSLAGLVACLFGVFGYVMGIALFVASFLKVFHPDRVGLWVGPHEWDLSMGSLTAAEQQQNHAHELLGWWLIPFGLIAGPTILVITTLLLRWALRFAFPRTATR